MTSVGFEWDEKKNRINQKKHKISFDFAQYAFDDPKRIIAKDLVHSTPQEIRYYCFGKIAEVIMTVRFTYRNGTIRIYGAGYWRKGKKIYDEQNSLHK